MVWKGSIIPLPLINIVDRISCQTSGTCSWVQIVNKWNMWLTCQLSCESANFSSLRVTPLFRVTSIGKHCLPCWKLAFGDPIPELLRLYQYLSDTYNHVNINTLCQHCAVQEHFLETSQGLCTHRINYLWHSLTQILWYNLQTPGSKAVPLSRSGKCCPVFHCTQVDMS